MKKATPILFVLFSLQLICHAQTVLPRENHLIEQYNNRLELKGFFAKVMTIADNSKENLFFFACNSSELKYNSITYAPEGSSGILLQLNTSTGEVVWNSTFGNQTVPLTNIESLVKDHAGNICMVARGNFQEGTALTLGSQTFTFRTDMKPTYVVATLNPSTHVWSKVRFVYAPDQQAIFMTTRFDVAGNMYLCGAVNSSNLYVDNTLVVTANSGGYLIFVYKEDANGTLVYKKQTIQDNPSILDNIQFEVDKIENLYIIGSISYITGAISLDGVVVKNDTIANKYDYSSTDIFLYKLNPSGVVQFGKTYLYSGGENPHYLRALSNGSLYMFGEYSGTLGSFPQPSGENSYNRFIANISGSTGEFNWIYPLNCNLYYSNRYPLNMVTDTEENFYFSSGFRQSNMSFMGSEFVRRNNKNGTSNTLCAKITPSGLLAWGRVLGPVTTFETSLIDNPKITSMEMGTSLFIQSPSISYGTNTEFAWGASAVPTTTMPSGYQGNMAVVDKNSGDINYGYFQGFTSSIEIDSLDYFLLRNNTDSWDVARYKINLPNSVKETKYNQNNDLLIYPNPVINEFTIKNLSAPLELVEIFSLDGKMVMKSTVVNDKVIVSTLNKGIYFVKANNTFIRFVKI